MYGQVELSHGSRKDAMNGVQADLGSLVTSRWGSNVRIADQPIDEMKR